MYKMKIVDTTTEVIDQIFQSKSEIGPAEKWLFGIENGEVRLFTLMKLKPGHLAVVELEEFRTTPGVSTADNETGWRMALAKLAALVEAA
jgi:hypothetical protein